MDGYTLVTLNNFFTAANGVYIKKKLDSKEFGKYGLMFYNALFMVVPAILFAYIGGEIEKVSFLNRYELCAELVYNLFALL